MGSWWMSREFHSISSKSRFYWFRIRVYVDSIWSLLQKKGRFCPWNWTRRKNKMLLLYFITLYFIILFNRFAHSAGPNDGTSRWFVDSSIGRFVDSSIRRIVDSSLRRFVEALKKKKKKKKKNFSETDRKAKQRKSIIFQVKTGEILSFFAPKQYNNHWETVWQPLKKSPNRLKKHPKHQKSKSRWQSLTFWPKPNLPHPFWWFSGSLWDPEMDQKSIKSRFFRHFFSDAFFDSKKLWKCPKMSHFWWFWVVRRAIWTCKTQVQMHFCIFRYFRGFFRILLHFEQILDNFYLIFGPQITRNHGKWGLRMQSKINLKINLKKVSQKCPKTALQVSGPPATGPPCRIGYANII